jgi:hypothetical protein
LLPLSPPKDTLFYCENNSEVNRAKLIVDHFSKTDGQVDQALDLREAPPLEALRRAGTSAKAGQMAGITSLLQA